MGPDQYVKLASPELTSGLMGRSRRNGNRGYGGFSFSAPLPIPVKVPWPARTNRLAITDSSFLAGDS